MYSQKFVVDNICVYVQSKVCFHMTFDVNKNYFPNDDMLTLNTLRKILDDVTLCV
jgi:hypothetical protein